MVAEMIKLPDDFGREVIFANGPSDQNGPECREASGGSHAERQAF